MPDDPGADATSKLVKLKFLQEDIKEGESENNSKDVVLLAKMKKQEIDLVGIIVGIKSLLISRLASRNVVLLENRQFQDEKVERVIKEMSLSSLQNNRKITIVKLMRKK